MSLPGAKTLAIRAASGALRWYFQSMPGSFGKEWLWHRVVSRHIVWRSLPIEARTRFGARISGRFPDFVHSTVYFFGVWEPSVTALFQAALRPGDVVIDVGANVGVHSLLAASLVGPTGRVHAVEASPHNFRALQANLAANGASNVRSYNMAATATVGPVQVFLHDDSNLGGTTIMPGEAARTGAKREAMVEGRPLPEIVPLAELLAARLIKIDVEGAEWLVLQGLRDVLPRLQAKAEILVEVNQAALAPLGASLDDVLALFAAAGFEPFEVPNTYDSSGYTSGTVPPLMPLTRRDFMLADLLFRRPGAHGQ